MMGERGRSTITGGRDRRLGGRFGGKSRALSSSVKGDDEKKKEDPTA